MDSTECESCRYYDYDEEYTFRENKISRCQLLPICSELPEVYRIESARSRHCPYYRQGDDDTLARRQ